MNLFRPSPIESRRRKLYGDVSLWQPVSGIYYSIAAIACVSLALVYLAIGKYSRKESVVGWVAPEMGLSQIYALRGGVVAETLVKQGDFVTEGQPIARLKIDLSSPSGEVIPLQRAQANSRVSELEIQAQATQNKYSGEAARLNGQIATSNAKYAAEIARLSTQAFSITQKFREDENRINQNIRANEIGVEKLKSTRQILSQNLNIEQTTLGRYKEALKSGGVSEYDVDKASQNVLSSKNQLVDIDRQIEASIANSKDLKNQLSSLSADINGQLSDLAKQKEALVVAANGETSEIANQRKLITPNSQSELSQIRSAKAQLESSLADLSVQDGYVVRAPISGTLVSLNLRKGEAANPNAPIASIAPQNSKIVAELLVPTRAAGFVKQGDDVRIMIDAFPYQKFGVIKATVEDITRSAFRPGEIYSPFDFKEPVYRIRALLPANKIKTYDKFTELQSGMTLKADIITDRRSFLEWILDPLFAAKAKME